MEEVQQLFKNALDGVTGAEGGSDDSSSDTAHWQRIYAAALSAVGGGCTVWLQMSAVALVLNAKDIVLSDVKCHGLLQIVSKQLLGREQSSYARRRTTNSTQLVNEDNESLQPDGSADDSDHVTPDGTMSRPIRTRQKCKPSMEQILQNGYDTIVESVNNVSREVVESGEIMAQYRSTDECTQKIFAELQLLDLDEETDSLLRVFGRSLCSCIEVPGTATPVEEENVDYHYAFLWYRSVVSC